MECGSDRLVRALAIVPVLLFHAGFSVFGGGFVGVDVFFVISGFLITSIISKEIGSGNFTVAKFYERRARRILPTLFTVCAACIPFAWMWMSPPEFRDFSRSLVAVTTFSSNILFWSETGYFKPEVELKPLLHTWSLAIEEQFYIFFPLLTLTVYRFRPKSLMTVIVGLSAASFCIAMLAATFYPSANFYLLPTRAWELGVGAMLAISASETRTRPIIADIGSAVGFALILYAVIFFTDKTPYPSQYTLAPVVGTALILKYSGSDRVFGYLLRTSVMRGIGLISYSLYLWHQPILAFIRLRSAYEPGISLTLIAMCIVFMLATITWHFVEAPFRDRQRFTQKHVFIFAAFVGSVLLSVGLAGHFANGFPTLNADRAAASVLEAKLSVNYGLSSDCEDKFTLSRNCRTSDTPEVAVWGDSFAMHLVDGLLAANPNIKLIQFTKSVCGPILGLAPLNSIYPEASSKGCLDFNNSVIAWLASSKGVKYVVLSSPFMQYTNSQPGNYLYTTQIIQPTNKRLLASKFLSTLAVLKIHGIIPIVISPPPNFGDKIGDDIGRCLYRTAMIKSSLHRCDFPKKRYDIYQRDVFNLLKIVEKQYKVVWLSDFICHGSICLASQNGIFIYRDGGHLSHEGSKLIGQRYLSEMSLFRGL